MNKESSTECWSTIIIEDWIKIAESNDFRMHYIMPFTMQEIGEVEGKYILDLGCGEGGYSRALANKGAIVTAVDGSEAMLAYIANRSDKEGTNIKILQRNANDLYDLHEDEYDIVLCSMMLMDVEDIEGTLKEIHRVLKPIGKVYFNPSSLL